MAAPARVVAASIAIHAIRQFDGIFILPLSGPNQMIVLSVRATPTLSVLGGFDNVGRAGAVSAGMKQKGRRTTDTENGNAKTAK
jgi:hypothetical protein